MGHHELIESECYSLIVQIASLLSYYNFELTPFYNFRYQNCKHLFYIGNVQDLLVIYSKLHEMATQLINDISLFYK